jgi:cysteine synthase A
MGRIYSNITWTIGNTPLVRLNRMAKGLHADVIVKVESFNPMGSVKERIGLVNDRRSRARRKEQKGHHYC